MTFGSAEPPLLLCELQRWPAAHDASQGLLGVAVESCLLAVTWVLKGRQCSCADFRNCATLSTAKTCRDSCASILLLALLCSQASCSLGATSILVELILYSNVLTSFPRRAFHHAAAPCPLSVGFSPCARLRQRGANFGENQIGAVACPTILSGVGHFILPSGEALLKRSCHKSHDRFDQ